MLRVNRARPECFAEGVTRYNTRMNSPRFVHLRLHSEYSVVDGNVRLDDAVKAAAKDGMGALALTDLANAFGLVRFYKEARGKGCLLYTSPSPRD